MSIYYSLKGLKGLRKVEYIKRKKKTVTIDDDEPPVDFPRQYIKKQKRKAVIPWIYNLRIGEHDLDDDGSTSPPSSSSQDSDVSEIPPPSWLGKCGCFRYRKRLCVPEPYNYWIDTGKPVDFPRQWIKKKERVSSPLLATTITLELERVTTKEVPLHHHHHHHHHKIH